MDCQPRHDGPNQLGFVVDQVTKDSHKRMYFVVEGKASGSIKQEPVMLGCRAHNMDYPPTRWH